MKRSAEREARLFGGVNVDVEIDMPWVVRLEFSGKTDEPVRCAGTVVHKKYILTKKIIPLDVSKPELRFLLKHVSPGFAWARRLVLMLKFALKRSNYLFYSARGSSLSLTMYHCSVLYRCRQLH